MKRPNLYQPVSLTVLACLAFVCCGIVVADTQSNLPTFAADDPRYEYVGRIDTTDPKLPRFWEPGVYISADFTGTYCNVLLNDQELWGNTHQFVEVVVDGVAKRYQLTGASNVVQAAQGLPPGIHSIVICKDTESGNGYLEFAGLQCAGLAEPPPLPKNKIEFIGDSITVGFGNDQTLYPCGQGPWYGQHNAYMSYGPQTARMLNAQWVLSAVSGIGMIHSCCNMGFTMPDVYDLIATRPSSDTFASGEAWDPARYIPDVVTVCLGQNDGTANSAQFVSTYEAFAEHLRSLYPKAQIVLLSSPMGNADLTAALESDLTAVAKHESDAGDRRIHTFFFSRSWNDGCLTHPSMASDTQIAGELSGYLEKLMRWRGLNRQSSPPA